MDLMSIAAGEDDMEVKRVSCFEASCQAFAPIIFDLNAESSGFVELLDSCNKVLVAKEKDPDIKQKLVNNYYYYFHISGVSMKNNRIKEMQSLCFWNCSTNMCFHMFPRRSCGKFPIFKINDTVDT